MSTTYKKCFTLLSGLLLSTSLLFTGCMQKETATEPLSRTQFVLGTTATITLYDNQSEELLNKAFDKLTTLEDVLSINKTGTLIDEINDASGKEAVAVDPATFSLIEKGLSYSELTDGAFDLTIGPLVKLWHIGFNDAKVPTREEIDAKLPLINYQDVVLDKAGQTVYLPHEGMMIDLGGIGKGYAADEVAELLRNEGTKHAIINLGGNVYTIGDKPGNKSWTIGVQDPFNPRGATIGTIGAVDQSLVTSGIYERYLTAEDGTNYHHILDPKTGYPFNNELAGVTIISRSSTDGDALSTATFALGTTDGLNFIEGLDDVEAIFVTTDKKVYITSGLKTKFTLTDPDFTLCN